MQGEQIDPCQLTPADRIRLHLMCPWRNEHEARFHIAGILREFGIKLLF